MWDVLVRTPLGRRSWRKFIMLFATLLVAVFGYLIVGSTPVFAAGAEWKDGVVIYNNHTYEGPREATTGDNTKLESGTVYYEYHDDASQKAYLIYFAPGTDPPNEQEATLAEYQMLGGVLTGPNSSQAIAITPQNVADPNGDSLKEGELNGCQIDGIGWLVCPATRQIAKGMDYIYGVISQFLEVKPLETTQQGALYTAWSMARNVANILFVIGFIILIYGQLSGGLASNYMVKKLLPRIVVAAIMVNLSYWICAIGIDISNILGYAVQDLFVSARNTLTQTPMDPISWESATELILTGGTATVATGVMGVAALTATGGSIVAAVYLLIPALLGVAISALVALVVLSMRQALIVLLVIIAPIAFVAYLLPNTEKWFERWRQTFITMLVLFPVFSVIFGGSQLAGTAIIQTAATPAIAILGMVVMIAPLVLTPMVIKFSGSLLGRIAGMINNPSKGLIDRTRNATKSRAEMHRDKNLARTNTGIHRYGTGRLARRQKRNELNREKRHEGYKKGLENRAHEWEASRLNRGPQRLQDAYNNSQLRSRKEYGYWDEQMRRADQTHHQIEAHHQAAWDSKFSKVDAHGNQNKNFDAALVAQEAKTRAYTSQSEKAKSNLDATIREMEAGENAISAAEIALNVKSGKMRDKVAADLGSLTTKLHDLDRLGVVEAERKASAEIKIKGQIAEAFKANEIEIGGVKIRDYAGGIEGASGAARVYAKATSEITAAYMENVKASRSVLSDYSLGELINVAQHETLRGGATASQAEIDPAIQEIVMTKGNNWSFQKLKDHISQQGMVYDEENNTYHEYDPSKEGGKGVQITDKDAIEQRRTRQQIFVDATKQTGLKIKSLSGTDRGNLENGTFYVSSDEAILRDIREKKISAARLAETDVDELMRTIQILRDPSNRGAINEDQASALRHQIDIALNDPQVSASIAEREQDFMRVISSYLDNEDPRKNVAKEDETYIRDKDGNRVGTKKVQAKAPRTYSTEMYKRGETDYGPTPGT